MTSVTSLFNAIFDNTAFRVFFAAWTGLYLVQIIFRQDVDWKLELGVMSGVFLISLYVLTVQNDGA